MCNTRNEMSVSDTSMSFTISRTFAFASAAASASLGFSKSLSGVGGVYCL